MAEHLSGGSGGVWYDVDPEHGPVVHRPTGPWTPSVHELLGFLAGLDGVPRVLGFDDEDREVLSFLPGKTIDVDAAAAPDATLAQAATWLRSLHDLLAGFRPGGVRVWRGGAVVLAEEQVVCHNDTGAYNWVVDGDRFVGLIDWDQAGPGHPLDDLAFLCWSGVPLFREVPVEAAARRVRLAAEAYGGVEASALLDAVADRMERASARIAAGIARGDAGMLALAAAGEPGRTRARVDAFVDRLPVLRAVLAG